MNAANPHSNLYHDVKIQSPYFKNGEGAQLHRYLVPEFVPRFLQQLSENVLDDSNQLQWQSEDRFSHHDKTLVLRQPIHKTFYLVSCEVICNRLGSPALDNGKITSAGFVVRRMRNGKEYSWMMENDEAVGWEESATGQRDPDVHRRICRNGILHPRENVATYTGEKTHPLHVETNYDDNGKRHTVLYGYVALGGNYISRKKNANAAFDTDSLNEFKKTAKQHLPWPYGERQPLSKTWKTYFCHPVNRGSPSKEFFELIRLLVNRYHLGEEQVSENDALQELAQSIYFYDVNSLMGHAIENNYSDETKEDYANYRKYSLWAWLNSNFANDENAIVSWMAEQEKKIEDAGNIDTVHFDQLPTKTGTASTNYSIFITPSDAREFRSLLDQRVLDNVASLANEMPVPKFQQDKKDVYQIVPFVRAEDDCGKERIYWADEKSRSELFRVAGHFDPNASRPTMIQMPSLKDLRSGLAKGVGMITPPDTFSLLNALNLKKGASEDVLPSEEPDGFGIQWICSFSLPVITLVAMILLMIMISLLNIIFFWLPWIKICLPFPKAK